MNIEEMLKKANIKLIENNVEDSSIIARVLLQFVLKIDRNEIILKKNQEISKEDLKKYQLNIDKIIDGIPMQYITHNQEFFGLNFYVDKNVLIPQPDTEILVEEVIKRAQKGSRILDMCTRKPDV